MAALVARRNQLQIRLRATIRLLAAATLLVVASGAAPTADVNAPTTPILDTFDGRGLEDPLYQWGNWAPTSIDGSGPTFEILGGAAGHNEGDAVPGDSYRAADATGPVEAYGTIAAAPENNENLYLYINLQQTGTAGWDGYRARWFHWIAVDGLYLEKVVDGEPTSITPPVQLDPAIGDTILIRNNAGTIELWHMTGGTWHLRLSAGDGSFTGGKIGLGSSDDSGAWDDFGGTGTTTSPPTAPDVPATGLIDQFERPNEDPLSQNGDWSPAPLFGSGQTLEVLGNAAGQNEGEVVEAHSFRTTEIIGDAEVHARIANVPNNNQWFHLYLHLQEAGAAGVDGYRASWFHWISTDGLYIQKLVDGAATTIAGPLALDPASGDTLLLRRFGLLLELWRRHAGVWTKLLSTIDGSYTSGRLGLGMDDDDGRWDDFGGGSLTAPPPPPPPPPPSGGPPPEQSRGICGGVGIHAVSTSRCLSDPVNTLTGAFIASMEDIALPGTGVSLVWARTYTSADSTSGRLGPGWTDSYATSLEVGSDGDVLLHGDEGQAVLFARQPDGSFLGAPGARSTLSAVAGGYELVRTDQVVYRFSGQGRLLSIADRNGQGVTLGYDAAGRLSTITDAAGRVATVSHDAAGLVSDVATADGRRVAYAYTGGRLTSVTDVRGKTWRYTYDAAGRLATIVDPLGHAQITNVYGPDGRVQRQTNAVGEATTFAWDAATETATATDPNDHVWSDVYDENVLVERADPLGNATTFAHDDDLNASSITSPAGEATSMTYDERGNLLTATAPASLGSVQKTFVYDGKNDPTRVTDARGIVTTYVYDAAGNVESVVQDGRRVASYVHDAAGRLSSSTDGNGETTTFTYDSNGNLVSKTDPLGSKTTYTYDDAGRMLTRVDPRGNAAGADPDDFTWRWTYDASGNVLTERDPLGGVTTHTYDDVGSELAVTDAKGRTTTFAYDGANRLLSETGPDPDGSGSLPAPVTSHTYDAAGNRRTETDVLGRTTTFAYDGANRLVRATGPDPDGAGPLPAPVTTSEYDDNGNLEATVEPRGNVPGANPADYRTSFTHDAAGRLLTTTDPLGNVTTNAYDAVGNLVSTGDANGHTTTSTYDGSGRVLTVTAPDGGLTGYTYDGKGNLLTRADANGHVTAYTYDADGRLTSQRGPDPDGPGPRGPAVTTHSYDADDNLATTVDANGNATVAAGDGRTAFGYDAASRLVRIDYSDSTPDVTFSYDAVGNRIAMTDGAGSETRSYDALDRLTSVTRGANTFSYGYDAVGNIARRTYPGGTTTVSVHDALDRMASATSGGQMTSYAYDAASNLTLTTLPSGNGHMETRAYDRAGRLTEVTTRRSSTILESFAVSLDAMGNPTQVSRTGALAETQAFTYDANDRITAVCFQAACREPQDPFVRWTYDRVGNRLTEHRTDAASTSYTYDAADRLTRAGTTTYAYDENGNQLSAGLRMFTYDLANRLRTTRSGSTTTTYSYDGDGVRLQASTGSSSSKTTNFVWDVNHRLPQLAVERNGAGASLRQYVYGPRRISMTSGSTTSYFHHDGLGSVTNMTSPSGARRWTWSYEPFGVIRTEQRSGGNAPANSMKFAGEYLDPTGLYHLRAREYEPMTGRFLRPDPVDAGVGTPLISAYIYAANRPTVLVDPSGETFQPSQDWKEFVGAAVSPEAALEPWPPYVPNRPRGRRPTLVHPIPRGYPAHHGAVHPTGGIEHYRALDFFPGAAAPVLAVQSGTVYRFSGHDPRRGEVRFGIYGWSLYLKADSGSDYFYTHLGSRTARLGRVRAGQVIGRVGRWVRPNGENKSHLHLGVYGGPVKIGMVARAPRVRAG
jgi:RHS repeat-associated protein